jgi:hypothetical protein
MGLTRERLGFESKTKARGCIVVVVLLKRLCSPRYLLRSARSGDQTSSHSGMMLKSTCCPVFRHAQQTYKFFRRRLRTLHALGACGRGKTGIQKEQNGHQHSCHAWHAPTSEAMSPPLCLHTRVPGYPGGLRGHVIGTCSPRGRVRSRAESRGRLARLPQVSDPVHSP